MWVCVHGGGGERKRGGGRGRQQFYVAVESNESLKYKFKQEVT